MKEAKKQTAPYGGSKAASHSTAPKPPINDFRKCSQAGVTDFCFKMLGPSRWRVKIDEMMDASQIGARMLIVEARFIVRLFHAPLKFVLEQHGKNRYYDDYVQ
uniref:Uncharacterized protein n=1 Tax=Romanomermis culicivorax TaxID=13658 RepID=A0A915IP00_ROMCU